MPKVFRIYVKIEICLFAFHTIKIKEEIKVYEDWINHYKISIILRIIYPSTQIPSQPYY